MKKYLIVLFLGVIVLISGCGGKKDEEIKFLEPSNKFIVKENRDKTLIQKKDEEIIQKYQDKESFILYLYILDCGKCMSFSEMLKQFVLENNILIYQTEITSKIIETFNYKSAPTLLIIKDGKIVADDEDYPELINTKDKIKDFLDDYIYLNIFSIDLENYDEFIEKKETFNLYIGRDDCGTCDVFKAYILDKGNFKKLYYFNTKKYRDLSLESDEGNEEYQRLREYLGFEWTPTIKKIVKGEVIDSKIYLDMEYYSGELVVNGDIKELNKTYKNYDYKRKAFIDYYNDLINKLLEE